ncbi:MAG: hypothetical protein DRP14_05375 [Candidatus Aenigmatarchaeota archaeon]|nr:MAG: hypothetical protein DRP14_05375 [Candidatus Aenigmarchaeota archaeon]
MGLNLFVNDRDFTPYQLIFLHWLQIYENLYQDLSLKELYMDEDVIENDILTDAYLLWKSKYKAKEEKKNKKQNGNILNKFPSIRMR